MKTLLSILTVCFTLNLAYANANEHEESETAVKELEVVDPGAEEEVKAPSENKSIEVTLDEAEQSVTIPQADTSINTFSKYNFLFYFIYKYKYEGGSNGFEEIKEMATN